MTASAPHSLSGTARMVRYFFRAYPGRSALMVGFMVLSGFAEGVGLALFLPLLGLVSGDAAATEQSELGRGLAAALAAVGLPLRLDVLLLTLVGLLTAKALFLWTAMNQVGYTIARVMTDLRLQMLDAVLRARWSYFVSQPSGLFTSAISMEAQKAATAYRCAATALAYLVQILIYLGIAVLASWRTALFAMAAGGLTVLLLFRLMAMARAAGKAQNAGIRALLAGLVDALQGIKPIKAMAREEHVIALLGRHARDLEHAQRRQVMASETLRAFQEPLMIAFLSIGFFAALTWLHTPFATLALMALLFVRVLNYLNSFVFQYQTLISHETDFWTLRDRIEAATARREPGEGCTAPPAVLHDGIAFDRVSFAYGEKRILAEATFTLPARAFVAIEGRSGAGKTTVADLVIGLLAPKTGRLLVDGVPLDTLDRAAWRRRIGYVPQEMFLFHDTILQNVTLGDPALSRADAEQALRAAGVWDVIAALPQGLDAVVGERGLKLSGGQRQRVAIARALARRPALLILDEVTTALDPATERALCETLAALKGSMTILSISHQPALSRIADLRLVIDDGRVTPREPSAA